VARERRRAAFRTRKRRHQRAERRAERDSHQRVIDFLSWLAAEERQSPAFAQAERERAEAAADCVVCSNLQGGLCGV